MSIVLPNWFWALVVLIVIIVIVIILLKLVFYIIAIGPIVGYDYPTLVMQNWFMVKPV